MIDGDDKMIAAKVIQVHLVDIDYDIGPNRMKEIALMTRFGMKPCYVRINTNTYSVCYFAEEPMQAKNDSEKPIFLWE